MTKNQSPILQQLEIFPLSKGCTDRRIYVDSNKLLQPVEYESFPWKSSSTSSASLPQHAEQGPITCCHKECCTSTQKTNAQSLKRYFSSMMLMLHVTVSSLLLLNSPFRIGGRGGRISFVSAFVVTPSKISVGSSNLPSVTTTSSLYSSSAWSPSSTHIGTGGLSSSTGNTRSKRVRDVLEKAKGRTGIQNINSETTSSVVSYMKPSASGSSNASPSMAISGLSKTTSSTRRYASISQSLFSLNDLDYSKVFGDSSVFQTQQAVVRSLPLVEQSPAANPSASVAATNDSELVAAVSETNAYVSPLPFTLPDLTDRQIRLLRSGHRVEEQASMSREGSGFVVMDIPAPEYIVWEALLDFEAYPENIDTVRSMRMFTNKHLHDSYIAEKPVELQTNSIACDKKPRHYGTGKITRASFVLSKFHLTIAAIHKYVPHPHGDYMEFTLDKACKNAVLQDAKGIWHTQKVLTDDNVPTTRLWLLCELQVSPMLPQFIVDYASSKAMPRATTWIQPTVERLRKRFEQL